jgi:hypothetical protein
MAEQKEVAEDPNRQWCEHVRATYRLKLPVRDEHAWTAIAREPLASEWEGPKLPKDFPTRADFARAVLVSVVEREWSIVIEWRGAQEQEREQLAEAIVQESQVSELMGRGNRPATDDEKAATMRAAKELAVTVIYRLAEEAAAQGLP